MASVWSETAVRAVVAVDAAPAREEASAARLVYVAIAVWGALLAAAGVVRHVGFHSGHFDLGNMTQAVWSTAHGRLLETTEMVSGVQFSRLGSHVDPLLVLLTPLWAAFPSPLLLVVVQAAGVASGALPVFWLARKHLSSPDVAVRFAAVYLLYPIVQWNALTDFHAVSLAIPLLLFAVWFLDEDNFAAFLPFAILAAASKEHMPLVVAGLGVWYAVRKTRWTLGLATAACGVVWFAIAVFVVMPRYAPPGVDLFADRFGQLGDTPTDVVRSALVDPLQFIGQLTELKDVLYVLVLLGPFAALFVFEPVLATAMVLPLGMNLLSSEPQQANPLMWYSAPIFAIALAAAILGAARLGDKAQRVWSRALFAFAALLMFSSPLLSLPFWISQAVSTKHDARAAAVALVPSGAPVSATNSLGGHLSERRRIFGFPVVCDAEWVVVDRADSTVPRWLRAHTASFADSVAALRGDPGWRLVYSREAVLVFRRMEPGASGACPRP